ncbi:MAG TPA: prolipoprotein diacylglyceryl transferase [Acidiferrobacteraceae bacterium]|nr:prolipoprotein diacylglyceryl transferase [Acidiferrobacteraceae bacterium]
MFVHPQIDPVAIHLGPLSIHWYGLMYLIGFVGAWWLLLLRSRGEDVQWTRQEVGDLVFYTVIGVIAGGRLGYVLFYNPAYYMSHPLEVFYVWTGGMSFHGGLIGVIVAMIWFGRQTKRHFFTVADFVAPVVPVGLGAGRIGNFINQELWGRVTDGPWGVVFPADGPLPRHPSQLYEAGLEGVVMFAVLWWYSSNPRARGAVSGLFLILYSVFRFVVEFVREPDAHLGYLAFEWLTMGQLLSAPMFLFGAWLIFRKQDTVN